MTIALRLGAAVAALTLAAAGVAAAAVKPPVVGPQRTWTGATAPLTIAGTGLHKGERIPRGDRIVYRDVTLSGAEGVNFTIRAPAGRRIRGVMPAAQSARPLVDFLVTNVRPKGRPASASYYPGGTRVTLRAREYPAGGPRVSGRIYALAS
ncbi:MAG TPA: hypothetical protein VG165_13080 [Solirubrobacteraceae bacterium]|jgi:hypothetical protein|nr:hypothetical protein [Solirubrobacteraceae bacterium]